MDLKQVHDHGQSIWLDYFRRELLETGEFERLVRDDDVRGVTTNPSIFEKAIAEGTDYDSALRHDVKTRDEPAAAIYERLVIDDIQRAADVLRPTFDASGGSDGFVSMEVSPYLARDTYATVAEARRLWTRIARPNVMIKVPGTVEGIPAIARLIADGVNVNVTLLFGREACRRVHDAYMTGLEARVARGEPIDRIASVASMFVSRIDVLVGKLLERRRASAADLELVGKVGIANAKLAYQDWKRALRDPRWQSLVARGARPQRLLWASTSTKDKRLPDVLYVEALLGPDTIDTMTPATLEAMHDHGHADEHLEQGLDEAREVMEALARAGISIADVARALVDDGVAKFSESFDQLMSSVERKRDRVLRCALDRMSYALPPALQGELDATLERWRTDGKVRRLWARDAALWTGRDEASWLDWLDLADDRRIDLDAVMAFADEMRGHNCSHVVVLGAGDATACAEMLARTFGRCEGYPELVVVDADSILPAQLASLESQIALASTLFVVATKSGTTPSTRRLYDELQRRVRDALGDAAARDHFIAITDAGTQLADAEHAPGFRRIFHDPPGVGERFSALSMFGMVPAALLGLDVRAFLDRAAIMARSCAASVPPHENAGVLLGAILGTTARRGRDKVTLVSSPAIAHLGPWLARLLAESTGEDGEGLVAIDGEPLGPPTVYGDDRVFVYTRLDHAYDASQDAAVAALEKAGYPVVHIAVAEPFDLGQEIFRWQIAACVAASLLGVNPFEPRESVESAEHSRGERPFAREGALALFAPDRDRDLLERACGHDALVRDYLAAHLARVQSGDHVALLACLPRDPATLEALQRIRTTIRDARRTATTLRFGPRATDTTGVVVQLTCDASEPIALPSETGQRLLRVDLGRDVRAGLAALADVVERALAQRVQLRHP